MPEEQWINRLVRYQYVEDILTDQRVLEVGCGGGEGAHYLAERAVEVVAIDTASARLAEARATFRRRNLTFALAEPDRLDQSDDAFDIVLVPELERWITRGALMPELARVLRPGGVALFAVPTEDAPNGMEYTDLLEYLAASWPHVRMMGEIPFHGTIVADFEPDEEELDPRLDCSLIGEDEPPTHYLALCGELPVASLGYSIVQVAPDAVDSARTHLEASLAQARRDAERYENLAHDLKAELERADEEVRQLQSAPTPTPANNDEKARSRELRSQVKQLREQLSSARAEMNALRAKATSDDLSLELERCREEIAEKEAEVNEIKEQIADAERRVLEANTRARVELTQLRRRDREQEQELDRMRREVEVSKRALEQARQTVRIESNDQTDSLTLPPLDDVRGVSGELTQERQRAAELRERLDGERNRVATTEAKIVEAQASAETANVRLEAAQRTLDEMRTIAEEQRKRAEGAERRSDTLLNRLEQDAAELSRLHQRVAELQGLRQADLWRIDELTGRVRDAEGGGTSGGLHPGMSRAELDKELMRAESRQEVAERKATDAESKVAQMEVRLKRAESEAATLSKWAEDLREELKAAKGESTVRPPTPEPEAAALRSELEEARDRVAALENRCEALMSEVNEGEKRVTKMSEELELARKAADSQVLKDLRARTDQVKRMEQQLHDANEQLEELESVRNDLRDVEQANAELAAAKRELQDLRARVTDLDVASEELERLRAAGGAPGEDSASAAEVVELRQQVQQLQAELDRARAVSEDAERLSVCERQLEALLDGALTHKEESDALRDRIIELTDLAAELRSERNEQVALLRVCEQRCSESAEKVEFLRLELVKKGRDLARSQGLLQRHGFEIPPSDTPSA